MACIYWNPFSSHLYIPHLLLYQYLYNFSNCFSHHSIKADNAGETGLNLAKIQVSLQISHSCPVHSTDTPIITNILEGGSWNRICGIQRPNHKQKEVNTRSYNPQQNNTSRKAKVLKEWCFYLMAYQYVMNTSIIENYWKTKQHRVDL